MKNPQYILITGASSGIGAALALYYAKHSISLYLTGRNQERLEEIKQKCENKGAIVSAETIDVIDKAAMADFMDGISTLDLVIANAGISGGSGGDKGEPMAQARKIFDINLTGVLNTIEPALSKMEKVNKGQIALISSLAGYRGYPSAPAYSASKGAVRYYGEGLRGALRQTNIKINVVCPGFVTSRITDANQFPMPFKMDADKAAAIIAKGLAKDKSRIALPLPMVFAAWFIGILPDWLAQKILAKAPVKMAIIKED